MITEDYVSFEIAKLLKEKGFGCATLYYYDKDGDLLFSAWRVDDGKNEFVAPTLQMAMKWLRDEYNIDIVVFSHKRKKKTYYARVLRDFYIEHQQKCNTYSFYEEACEAAIKYCLENLI